MPGSTAQVQKNYINEQIENFKEETKKEKKTETTERKKCEAKQAHGKWIQDFIYLFGQNNLPYKNK